MQLWFLRTDKDNFDKKLDISESNEFIYSAHGSCGHQDIEEIKAIRSNIFPVLKINETELRKYIQNIKSSFVKNQIIDLDEMGKKRCDLIITYWIVTMQPGDIVIVRNKDNNVYICEITGYINEDFYNTYGSFQRPVRIIDKITPAVFHQHPLHEIQHRTCGRNTLQRNRQSTAHDKVISYIATLNKKF